MKLRPYVKSAMICKDKYSRAVTFMYWIFGSLRVKRLLFSIASLKYERRISMRLSRLTTTNADQSRGEYFTCQEP
jgi:hypothetical protein